MRPRRPSPVSSGARHPEAQLDWSLNKMRRPSLSTYQTMPGLDAEADGDVFKPSNTGMGFDGASVDLQPLRAAKDAGKDGQ